MQRFLFLVILLAGILFQSLGHAQMTDKSGPCVSDMEKFCKGINPRNGGIARCLRANENDLSRECKLQRGKLKKDVRSIAKACRSDYRKFCPGTKPGKGDVIKCMNDHREKLSDLCKKAVKNSREPQDLEK